MKNLHGYARELAIDEMLNKQELLDKAGREWAWRMTARWNCTLWPNRVPIAIWLPTTTCATRLWPRTSGLRFNKPEARKKLDKSAET